VRKASKHALFWKKARQKTFAPFGPGDVARARVKTNKSFCALFSKSAAFLLIFSFAHAQNCGTLVMPTGAGQTGSDDLTSFSPIFSNTAYDQEASWLLYPNLLWINRFSQIDWSRSLASAVTTTDNQTFTVTMRPWHWSDGVPVSASDVAYAFKLIQQLGPLWPDYGGGGLPYIVKSLKVIDPMHFQVTTVHPVNGTWFLYNGISSLSPLPEHAWGKYTMDEMFALQSTPSFYSVVDGPLKLQRFDIGLDAVFVPNPEWEGRPMHFTRLVFRFLQGDGANVAGVESGDLDEANLPSSLYKAALHLPGFHVEVLPQAIYENVYVLNYRNPDVAFFRDYRVRQAMADAVDQMAIVNGLEHGDGDPAYGTVPRSMVNFLTPAMRAGIYPVGYNPAKARELLREAGWSPGPDGIMQKDGKRLSFVYLEESGTDVITELDEIEQADFRKVGIEMNIKQMEFNQMIALMAGAPTRWDVTGLGQAVPSYPSGEGEFETGAGQNMEGYSDPKMDALINTNINTPGIQHLYDYETYISEQQPVIWGPRERAVILVNNRLHGIRDFIDPIGQYAPDQLWCTRE
jgi:peptide/nickel transport system substrate-binding protein